MKEIVRCWADHTYPGHPREVWDSGRWQPVTQVLDEVFFPVGKRFRVICENQNEFCLEYDLVLDQWQVTPMVETRT
jgi:hypothetical protein